MSMLRPLAALSLAGLLAACATEPSGGPSAHVQNQALTGAAIGALAGGALGAISGDLGVGTGAAIGALAGGGIGAYKGCREDGGCGGQQANRRQYYDERAGRYYYYDPGSRRYYWENGEPRY